MADRCYSGLLGAFILLGLTDASSASEGRIRQCIKMEHASQTSLSLETQNQNQKVRKPVQILMQMSSRTLLEEVCLVYVVLKYAFFLKKNFFLDFFLHIRKIIHLTL